MKSSEYVKKCVVTESYDLEEIRSRLQDESLIRVLHAALGLATEAAEILDMVKKHVYYGKELDLVNLKEELGDSNWYQSILVDLLDLSWEDIWETNIEKLQKRYGNKFSKEKALNRDLEKERKILEK